VSQPIIEEVITVQKEYLCMSETLDPSRIHIVDSISYFPDSETYDGLSESLCRDFAEGSIVQENNPMYLGGIELVDTDDGDGVYGYTGFSVALDATESDWFQHHYSSKEHTDVEDLVIYFWEKIQDERNVFGTDYQWAEVEKNSSWYNIRLYWSSDTDQPPTEF
jgi:hypothetical protein